MGCWCGSRGVPGGRGRGGGKTLLSRKRYADGLGQPRDEACDSARMLKTNVVVMLKCTELPDVT